MFVFVNLHVDELFCYILADTYMYIHSTFVLILDTGSTTLQCKYTITLKIHMLLLLLLLLPKSM